MDNEATKLEAEQDLGGRADTVVMRCLVTGNPLGTDAWAEGYVCPCKNCSDAYEKRERRIIKAKDALNRKFGA